MWCHIINNVSGKTSHFPNKVTNVFKHKIDLYPVTSFYLLKLLALCYLVFSFCQHCSATKLHIISCLRLITNLGMFRNTMHWNFSSWILGVKSVPSHWGRQRKWNLSLTAICCIYTQFKVYSVLYCTKQLVVTLRFFYMWHQAPLWVLGFHSLFQCFWSLH